MCCFLNSANGNTGSHAILESLNQYGVAFKNVLGLASDLARYMSTCFAALQIVLGYHTIHFKCWAHKVNLVGDVFVCEFSDACKTIIELIKVLEGGHYPFAHLLWDELMQLSSELKSKTKLPPFSKVSDDQFMNGYLYFHELLKGRVCEGSKIDLPQLLLAVSITKPEFGAAAVKTI
ncbi:hypothetical protein PR048_010735 [Dryococelus australis]|uniref:Uncharacterized protein n=1 Tax=Dryococelus australis TaxID=614101 RepID=A0ABQ9I4L9_9NEOP|nr:hypothetical protein PR048_010735 [Dryococelus australis]